MPWTPHTPSSLSKSVSVAVPKVYAFTMVLLAIQFHLAHPSLPVNLLEPFKKAHQLNLLKMRPRIREKHSS